MNNIIKRVWNQNRMVNIEALTGMAFQAEDGGHTFEISGINDANEAVSLSGTVAGVFMRPDGTDVALTGTASDGVVSVTLSDACYAVAGRFGLTIFLTSNSQKTAVYAAVGTVTRTSGGAVAGDTPQDVVDLINAINAAVATIPADYTDLMAAIAPTYSNTALYAVGSYAWYSGVLYKCTTAITTAESWTAAHWTVAVLGNDVASIMTDVTSNEKITFTDGYINIVAEDASVDLSVLTDTTTVCAVVNCKAGDIFYISGTPINHSAKRPFMFVTSENVCYFRSIQNEKFAEEVVAPITGKLVLNLSKSADYAVYRNKVELSLWMQAAVNGLVGIVPQNYIRRLATGTTETNKAYSLLNVLSGSTENNITTDTYTVTGGELLIASGIVPSSTLYRLALFYDADGNFLGYHNRIDGQKIYVCEPIICPPKCAYVRFTHSSIYQMRVYRAYTDVSKRKRVTRDGNLIKVSDGTYTLWMSKHGNNNLMDLQYIRKGDTNLHTTGTDWQGPYVVAAKNNADGDAIAQGKTYTGGNHAYAYDGSSGSATARTISFKVVADGIELEDGGDLEWHDYVEISWVNRVQAWNTKKSDGTGREVLEENPVWTFRPHGIVEVQNTITALEDITVSMYYGMQMTASWLSKGLFIPTATRDIDSVANIYNGFGSEFDGSVVKGYDANLDITMELDTSFDLGTGVCIGDLKQTHINATKSYMRTVSNTDFDEDNVFAYRGRYTFRYPNS